VAIVFIFNRITSVLSDPDPAPHALYFIDHLESRATFNAAMPKTYGKYSYYVRFGIDSPGTVTHRYIPAITLRKTRVGAR
jgi:hypothetical protein